MCSWRMVRSQSLFIGMIVVVDPWSKPQHAADNEHDTERNHHFEH
jgi:hypothetical protein